MTMDENESSGIIHSIDGTCVRYKGIIFAIDLDDVFLELRERKARSNSVSERSKYLLTPTSFYFTVTLQDFSPPFSLPEVTFVTESLTANPLARNAVVD